MELNDKTLCALVTGAMSGIGKATAARLAEDGIRVVTLDRQPGADVCVDLTDESGTKEAVEKIGRIDILVNSAGIVGPNCALWESEAQEWQQTFEVNVFALVRLLRLVVPGMRDRGWGRIVNLASIAGKDGNPNLSSYSASKAAVIGLTKSLGKELATSGVLVNAVAPAVIATEMNASTAPEVLTPTASTQTHPAGIRRSHRSPITVSSPTATRARSSPPTGRSSGCACRTSTRRRSSARCSTAAPVAGA